MDCAQWSEAGVLLDWEARELARVLNVLVACDLVGRIGRIGQIATQKASDDSGIDSSGLHCFQELLEEPKGQEEVSILHSATRSIWSCAQICNAMGVCTHLAEGLVRHWPFQLIDSGLLDI